MKVEDVIFDAQDDGSGSQRGSAPIHLPFVLYTSFIPVPASRSNWLEIREKWQSFPKVVEVLITMTRK